MSRIPSATDARLIAAGSIDGVRITCRQLERWRQLGAIPRPRRRSLGRGIGTATSYEPYEITYIVEFARRARRHLHWFRVVLWIYIDGGLVPEACLRGAYRALFEGLESLFAADNAPEAVWEMTEQLAASHQRRSKSDPMRRAIAETWQKMNSDQQTENGPFDAFERDILTSVAHLAITGEELSDIGLRQVMSVMLNNPDFPVPHVELTKGNFDDMTELMTRANFASIRTMINEAPWWALLFTASKIKQEEESQAAMPRRDGIPTVNDFLHPLIELPRILMDLGDEQGVSQFDYEQLFEIAFADAPVARELFNYAKC